MPRLNAIEPDQAQGELKEVYDQVEKKMGKVPNIFKGMANSPAALKAYLNMSQTLKGGELSDQDREVIYLAASETNHCHYCVSAHTQVAKSVGISEEQALAIRRGDPQDATQRALARFTRRVMETKGFVEDEDLQAIRDAGYSDGQIAEVCGMIGLATFSNLFNHVHQTPVDFPEAAEVG